MAEKERKKFQCNDCLNSKHGCINKIKGLACPGGIKEAQLIDNKVPEDLYTLCKGRPKIPFFKKPKKIKPERQKV